MVTVKSSAFVVGELSVVSQTAQECRLANL